MLQVADIPETDNEWWGYGRAHGWIVLDWNDPRNRPRYEAVRHLYPIRCGNWQEAPFRWADWSPPAYLPAKDWIVTRGSELTQRSELGVLQAIQRVFYSFNTKIQAIRGVHSHYIPFMPAKNLLDLCDSLKLPHLYHITHVDNLAGILAEGLLCHRRAKPNRDISNPDIQRHRAAKSIPGDALTTLHDCVPLFVAARAPMLSARREEQTDIVYLLVSPAVLLRPKVIFADGNARSNATRFFSELSGLSRLDWDLLRARYWSHEDPEVHRENMRKRAAEVLVPDCIPCSYIDEIAVMTQATERRVAHIVLESGVRIPVVCVPELYYPAS